MIYDKRIEFTSRVAKNVVELEPTKEGREARIANLPPEVQKAIEPMVRMLLLSAA